MNITRFPVNPFVVMTYILWTGDGGEAAIVDPGMMRDKEREMIAHFIDEHQLKVKHILLSHIHIDHVSAAKWMAQTYSAPIEGNVADESLIASLPMQAAFFHLNIDMSPFTINKNLCDGDSIMLGDEEIKVLETPGHSLGSLSFYLPQSGFVVTGDALFQGSIGRTDLPGGDFNTLINSIKQKLLTLPQETVVYPGHGDETTIGDEERYNQYL